MATTGAPARVIGRYQLFDPIASGGMATVHYGRIIGSGGFARTVAIKRLHPHMAESPELFAMLIDEARLAARIRHPNVVSTLDVVSEGDETILVMDYVQGVSLAHALANLGPGELVPVDVAIGVVVGALYGLHAAHEARSESGELLFAVHRDVSPQNILLGVDGIARVADFGIAKATGRMQSTADGQLKGKSAYMAPEQIRGLDVDRRTDIYAATVVLWETLTRKRLFTGQSHAAIMNSVLEATVPPPSRERADVPPAIDEIVARGLARDPAERFATAREMAIAIERTVTPASPRAIGEWVEATAAETLARRADDVQRIESSSVSGTNLVAPVAPLASVASGRGAEDAETKTLASTASDVRASSPSPEHARANRRRALLASVTLFVVAGVVFASALVLRARRSSAPAASTGEAPSLVPSSVTPASLASDTPGAAPPVAVASDVPLSSSSAPPVGSARPAAHTGVTHAKPPSSHPLNCKPPYTIDADGTRVWKKGC